MVKDWPKELWTASQINRIFHGKSTRPFKTPTIPPPSLSSIIGQYSNTMCNTLCNTLGNIFRLVITFACGLALAMQILTALSCELVNVTGGAGGTYGIFFRGTNNQCQDVAYDTEDPLVLGARSALIVSMCAGFIAGLMVTFEWLCVEVCCAGVLEGLAFLLAWFSGGSAFMFYGTELCTTPGVDCEFTQGSTFLTVAVVCYFGCGFLLCFTPQPDPICRRRD